MLLNLSLQPCVSRSSSTCTCPIHIQTDTHLTHNLHCDRERNPNPSHACSRKTCMQPTTCAPSENAICTQLTIACFSVVHVIQNLHVIFLRICYQSIIIRNKDKEGINCKYPSKSTRMLENCILWLKKLTTKEKKLNNLSNV